jgi:nicotine blue oxidoreductase
VSVAGLVLAAGAGRRFGGPKAVAELDGELLVDRAVRTLRGGGAEPVYVVSGAVALDAADAAVVPNPDWREGIGSSLRAGLAALHDHPDVDAVVVVLVDQPGLTADAVRRVLSHAGGRDAVAAATYDGALGHPVALGRDHWAEVARLAVGERGARPFLDARPELLRLVECGDVATATDVDRPEDLEAFRASTP